MLISLILKKELNMLGKIKTIANIGSVIMSAILVGLQVVGLVKNGKSNPVDTDGVEPAEG